MMAMNKNRPKILSVLTIKRYKKIYTQSLELIDIAHGIITLNILK
ncbi:hypothetical protein BH18THE2_BH18THE2_09340 [soil metagenome]